MSAANKVFDDEATKEAEVVPQAAIVARVNRSEKENLQQRALVLVRVAQDISVVTATEFEIAREFLDELMKHEDAVEQTFGPHIAQANSLHKALLAEKKKFIEPVERAKSIVKPKIGVYIREQDRLRLEAERKKALDEAAARRLAEEGVDKAHALMKEGDDEAAEAVINETHSKVETMITQAAVVPEKIDTQGISLRQRWTYRIVDERRIPRKYLMIDEKKIAFIVSKLHEQAEIEGIEVFAEDIVAAKRLG